MTKTEMLPFVNRPTSRGWPAILLLNVVLALLQGGCSPDALPARREAPQAEPPSRKLFIVAPHNFHPALVSFVEHKKKLLPTELVSLEQVLKSTEGVDDPERLKRFLYAAWKERNLGYVLLVGDVDAMPVRYMVLDRATPAAFDFAFYPSDLYYSDLARQDGSFDDWNASKEGFHSHYFGEVRGEKNKKDPINFDQIDYRPDIAVGRWPVSTPEEVRVVATKSIVYEEAIRSGKHPGLRRADVFHVAGWVDARDRLDRLADGLPSGWKTDRYFFRDRNPKHQTSAPDRKNLLAALNAGAGLVVHAGHGSEKTWEGCFSVADLDQVKNADRLPVLVSAGCSTAYFAPLAPYDGYVDVHGKEHVGTYAGEVFKSPPPPPAPYQKGKYNPTGLGEQLLKRGPDGAVVYIGCNTGSQPCALTLLDGFVNALAKAEHPRVGDCWASAIRYYYDTEGLAKLKPNDDWYPPSIFFQGMKFMLFGDPTLPLGEGRP
jgi:Peptidase family C25